MTELLKFSRADLPESQKRRLLGILWTAQAASAASNTNNASNQTVANVAGASLSLSNALAAAILASGGMHAPVCQAREKLFRVDPNSYSAGSMPVPGFGNSFFTHRKDPNWADVEAAIAFEFPELHRSIQNWERRLHSLGKTVYVNAAGLTAAVAEALGWDAGLEPLLFIAPRLSVWAGIYRDSTRGLGLYE